MSRGDSLAVGCVVIACIFFNATGEADEAGVLQSLCFACRGG